MNKEVLSALVGLVGAVNNNGKTKCTDRVIRESFRYDDFQVVEKIHKEKYSISPGCEFCQSPCGNTSDYPLENYNQWSREKTKLIEQIMDEAKRIIDKTKEENELPKIVYKAIGYVGYDLADEAYRKLLEEFGKC